jgi:hypothetical protein
MTTKELDHLILQLENYLECWKQFSHFISAARTRKFTQDDEVQFLDVKSVLVQELELILAKVDYTSPTKEEVIAVVSSAPSLRFLAEMPEGSLRGVENQWHKVFISWQSNLGMRKVKQREVDGRSWFAKLVAKPA